MRKLFVILSYKDEKSYKSFITRRTQVVCVLMVVTINCFSLFHSQLLLYHVNNSHFMSFQKNFSPAKFSLSADKRYLLMAQNVQKLFRHSYLAQYTVFDIQTRFVRTLTHISIRMTSYEFFSQWNNKPHTEKWRRVAIFTACSIHSSRTFYRDGLQLRHLLQNRTKISTVI